MKDLKQLWIEQQVGMKLKAGGLDPLYEYYNTGDDADEWLFGTNWAAQTFTVGAAGHTVTSVKLLLYRVGSPGTITVSIRATDIDGHPTGSDLTSGTIDGNTLTDTKGVWYEIALTEYTLSTNTKYAIVVRAPNGNVDNKACWRMDYTSPTYADGNLESSTNSGSTWTFFNYDLMFEVWGNPLAAKPKGTIAIHAKLAGII